MNSLFAPYSHYFDIRLFMNKGQIRLLSNKTWLRLVLFQTLPETEIPFTIHDLTEKTLSFRVKVMSLILRHPEQVLARPVGLMRALLRVEENPKGKTTRYWLWRVKHEFGLLKSHSRPMLLWPSQSIYVDGHLLFWQFNILLREHREVNLLVTITIRPSICTETRLDAVNLRH